MKRRAFLLATTMLAGGSIAAGAEGEVAVIYIGGWDCPPCHVCRSLQRVRPT